MDSENKFLGMGESGYRPLSKIRVIQDISMLDMGQFMADDPSNSARDRIRIIPVVTATARVEDFYRFRRRF